VNQQAMYFSRADQLAGQAEEILFRNGGPWPIGADEKSILMILRMHLGAERAIKIRELVEKTGLDPRAVKEAVRSLVIDFKLPIASSKAGRDGGYFLILTDTEQRDAVSTVSKQIRAEAMRLRVLAGAHDTVQLLGQLQLEVTK
jgi:hypothetical protein